MDSRSHRSLGLGQRLLRALVRRRVPVLLGILVSAAAAQAARGSMAPISTTPTDDRATRWPEGFNPQMASPPVLLDYDQAALDREYNNRAKVADSAQWLARYPRQSALARAKLPARLDVAYGSPPGERLDLFLPPEPGRAPIHVFIHGGYWHRLDKSDFSFVALGLRPAGAAVAVINHALIPTGDMDELVRQCRAAIAWLHRHAASFGGDPDRLSVSGHSAGGHLVAMLMATDWREFGAPADVIKAGCGISGLYDLEPIRLSYLNEVLQLTPAVARRNSPVHLFPPRPAPLFLTLGGLEGPEYDRQTQALAAAWRTRGVPCDVRPLAGHDHFSIISELEDPRSGLSRAIHRQLGLGSCKPYCPSAVSGVRRNGR